jgi:hypothetical protein
MSPSRAGAGPAGRQGHADQVAVAQLGGVDLLLEVQQAEVVLAPLADHGLAGAPPGRDRSPALALDLALQGAGVGRDPHRPVGLGPQRGRGQVAQGLADPGAGLGQHHVRLALALARLEGEGGLGGVVGLGDAGLVQARALQQFGQPDARPFGIDRLGAGLAGRRLGPPTRQPRPDVEARERNCCRPGPSAAAPITAGPRASRRGPGSRRPPAPPRGGLGASGPVRQQGVGGLAQGLRPGLGALGLGQAQGLGQAGGGRGAELGRADEGEQLQRVEDAGGARRGVEAEPRAVIAAWARSTGRCSNRSRASGVRSGRPPPSSPGRPGPPSAKPARGPGSTTRAGARSRVGICALTRGFYAIPAENEKRTSTPLGARITSGNGTGTCYRAAMLSAAALPPLFSDWFAKRGWSAARAPAGDGREGPAGARRPADRPDRRRQDPGRLPAQPDRALRAAAAQRPSRGCTPSTSRR